MSNLLIDLGNSSIKAALLRDGRLGEVFRFSHGDADALIERLPEPASVTLASVLPAPSTDAFTVALARAWSSPVKRVVTEADAFGVRIAYADPDRLGVDRWLALIAAHRHHPGDVVIADLGSALTVDVLRADGEHLGGVIAPGFDAMFTGLSGSTTFPPPALPETDHADLGRDTGEAVSAGRLLAQIGVIREVLDLARLGHGLQPHLLLTGGDAGRVVAVLGDITMERSDDLVLRGLAITAMA